MTRLVLVLALVLAAGERPAHADDARPAILDLAERAPGRWHVVWTTPMRGDATLRMAPRFPPDARVRDETLDRTVQGDRLIERYDVELAGGLAGREIGIDGLVLSTRDVIVRIGWQDGRRHHAVLRGARPTLLVPEPPSGEAPPTERLARATQSGLTHGLSPPHLLLGLAFALAGGLAALGGPLLAFVLLAWAAAVVASGTLDEGLAAGLVAVVAAVTAREAVLGGPRRLVVLAGLAGLACGLGLPTASGLESLGRVLAIDTVSVAAGLVLATLLRPPFRAPFAWGVGLAAVVVAILVAGRATAAARETPSLAGLPSALSVGPEGETPPPPAAPRLLQTPAAVWLDVGVFETRLELLAHLDVLGAWLAPETALPDPVDADAQTALLATAADALARTVSVAIEGAEANPDTVRMGIADMDATGTWLREPADALPRRSGVAGITLSYSTPSVPGEVRATFASLPGESTEVPARTIDMEVARDTRLTAASPSLTWRNELERDPFPPLESVDVRTPDLGIPVLSLLLTAAVLLAGILLGRGGKARLAGIVVPIGLTAACLGATVAVVRVPSPWDAPVPEPAEAQAITAALLENVYRAFDGRDEESVYDRLALGVTGDMLADVYLEQRRALVVERVAGGRAHVEVLELTDLDGPVPVAGGGFEGEATWTVAGSVTHFGHRHLRQNRYRADVRVVPVDGTWKISRLEVRNEERLR